jgi:hypothetical protein
MTINTEKTPSPASSGQKALKSIHNAIAKAATLNPLKTAKIAPSWEAIGRKAYEIWMLRGQEQGRDQEHWFEAEQQLRQSWKPEARMSEIGEKKPKVAAGNRNQREWYNFMYLLKLIYLTTIQLVKQVWFLPQSFANAVEQRRRLVVRNELEAERLDRIRNPLKYLGKWLAIRPGSKSWFINQLW